MKGCRLLLCTMAFTVALSCGGGGNGSPPQPDSTAVEELPVLDLPGSVSGPDSSGALQELDTGGADAVLLYYWLPLAGYEESEADLRFLAALGENGTVVVLPVQFDAGSRNYAQTLVNDLGVSLTVYLGDGTLLEHLSPDVLPLSVLFVPGRESRETGFGGPERLLVGDGMGDGGR